MARNLQVWFNVATAQLGTPLGLTARRRGWRHVLVALVTTAAALADGGFKNGSMREGSKGQVCLPVKERKKERKKRGGVATSEHLLPRVRVHWEPKVVVHPTVGAWGCGGQSAAPGLQKNRSEPTTT